MLLDIILRVQASPLEHLGARDLDRLRAFEMGYKLAQPASLKDYPIEEMFRDWVILAYKPIFNISYLSAYTILQVLAPEQEQAFDAFFFQLDRALIVHPEAWYSPITPKPGTIETPLPVSAYLDALTKRPGQFLPQIAPGCLRAFLDGIRLARLDEGHTKCADLDGFEKWVEEKLKLRGVTRWENAVHSYFGTHERQAFNWSMEELKNYRATLGPLPEKNYEIASTTNKR